MCQTQSGKFMTTKMAKVDFCLSEFSAIKNATRKYYVSESTESRYYMTLDIYLLTVLGLDLKFSKNFIVGGERP